MLNRALRKVPTWAVYIAGALPAVWMTYQTLTGTIGIDPVRAIEWGLGLWALRLLIATLCVTPLRWMGLNLMRFRRQLGLVAFAYVCLHFTAWVTIDMGLRWGQILPDLVKRWYIVVGMAALLLLVPLAATSNNAAIRFLGAKRWNRVHMLAYPATILATVHFLMVGKVYTAEVLTYAGILFALLAIRVARFGLRKQFAA
jgi:sulfoxide reductase heme-binding subunit YedZ